jgi:hypothetical protein
MAKTPSIDSTALSNALVFLALPLVLPIVLKLAPVKAALRPALEPLLGKPWGSLPSWLMGLCVAVAAWQGLVAIKPLFRGMFSGGKLKSSVPRSHAGESAVANTLAPLEGQGWKIDYHVPGLEDVIWVKSAKGKAFAVVLRHHKGKISHQGDRLCRIYDKTMRPFEDDMLALAQRRATAVGQIKGGLARPILVFPEALLEGLREPVAGVQVVNIQNLRKTLLSHGG